MIDETATAMVAVAAGMAVATALLVRFASEAREGRHRAVAVFLVAMMAEMFLGAWVGIRLPSRTGTIVALAVSGALMTASAAALVAYLGSPGAHRSAPPGARGYRIALAGLVLSGEGLMAATFVAVGGALPPGLAGVAASVVSPWFVFTMAAEMAISTAVLWGRLPSPLRVVFPLQAVMMAATPPALGGAVWPTVSLGVGSVAMVAVIVFQMEHLYRHRTLPAALARYWLALLASLAVMMTGLVVWMVYGSPAVLAAGLLAEMVVYLGAALAPAPLGAEPSFTWQLRPGWTTALLGLVFVGELMMGAALDLGFTPGAYAGSFFTEPLTGSAGAALYAAFYDGFWFFASVAGSTWFLAMMGAEMGALVVLKLRETHDGETRVRLALMIACYGAFAVFFPSLYYARVFPHAAGATDPTTIPVLGWSMGLGSAPVSVSVFGVILATYVATAVLSLLFGRRWLCSVFCTAPLMYQGTTIDAMKRFDQTSPLARRFLSSRWSAAYTATFGVTLAALTITSAASYLDSLGVWNVSVLGADPSVAFFAISFNVLWYVLFVTIPYAGTYNCVSMGWCYTGAIAGAIGRFGLFKLKVRDREVCRRCTTVDCARACPVGLVDMPGHFRKTGEFRSVKCCGVGGCVGACPYGNLYIHDVRHWLRRRVGLPDVPRSGSRLPMVTARAVPPARSSLASPEDAPGT